MQQTKQKKETLREAYGEKYIEIVVIIAMAVTLFYSLYVIPDVIRYVFAY